MYLVLLPLMPTLFMMSLISTAKHVMAVLMAMFCNFQMSVFKKPDLKLNEKLL